MICEHPECTGVHDHSKPRAEWCPAAVEARRKYDRQYDENHREERLKYSRNPQVRFRQNLLRDVRKANRVLAS